MSRYTLIALCIIVSGNVTVLSFVIGWIAKELKKVEKALQNHDEYIDDTAKIINQMSTDIAVTRESVQNIETAVTETKTAVTGINSTLMDKLTKRW